MSEPKDQSAGSLGEKVEKATESVKPKPNDDPGGGDGGLGSDAYNKCVADHVGQAGYCDSSGNWHPAD